MKNDWRTVHSFLLSPMHVRAFPRSPNSYIYIPQSKYYKRAIFLRVRNNLSLNLERFVHAVVNYAHTLDRQPTLSDQLQNELSQALNTASNALNARYSNISNMLTRLPFTYRERKILTDALKACEERIERVDKIIGQSHLSGKPLNILYSFI